MYTEDADNLMKLKFMEKIKMESCPEKSLHYRIKFIFLALFFKFYFGTEQ